ncbi:MAG: DNA-directed DNA polymerase II small subunit [archaeon]
MSKLSSVVLGLRERGIILDRGALDFIDENNISREEIEGLKIKSLILTREILERELKRLIEPVKEKIEDKKHEKENIVTKTIKEEPEAIKPCLKSSRDIPHSVIVENLNCYEPAEKNVGSFVEYFNARYNAMKNILAHRQELKNLVSIGRFTKFSNDKNISVIGLVSNISKSKNDNTILEIEDPTGRIKAIIKENKDIGEGDILNDEVLGITGSIFNGFLFVESIVLPDVPLSRAIRRVNDAVSAAFISDTHYGSKYFSQKIESRFLNWIRSSEGAQVKYLFICGDIVDGVGIYPGQEADLLVKDIYAQYALFEEFIMKIPEHIQIILCPGNHDAVRMGEPQPILPRELVPKLHDMKNVYLTTNPAYVNIHAIDSEGINVLMYHGYSFTSIVDAVPYLRQKGLQNPQHVMTYVLRRRHLAPTYGSTIAIPEKKDSLIITKIPDIFQTGDLHSHAIDNYKGITLISSSTFQNQTPFMDRVGHIANPGKVTVVDLNTRNTRCLDFTKE